jgi:hypothetical protein
VLSVHFVHTNYLTEFSFCAIIGILILPLIDQEDHVVDD